MEAFLTIDYEKWQKEKEDLQNKADHWMKCYDNMSSENTYLNSQLCAERQHSAYLRKRVDELKKTWWKRIF
jgi:predicted  nucleic acid-binding Zn-ribbon protein